jgi:hypothetical protein
MKKVVFITFLIVLSVKAQSQESAFTLSGGYAFANIQDIETRGTGWRINGLYEFNPAGGVFAHGISIGYISIPATDEIGSHTIEN